MTFKPLYTALLAATTLLAACQDAPTAAAGAPAGKAATTPVSTAALASEATGFSTGPAMSARTVYVFFDAQCTHCGALWYAAKPLQSQAKFVWVPVGLLNNASTSQGATLLAASDPAAAMDQHKASLMARGGGISAAGNIDAQKLAIQKNTALHQRFGFAAVPTVVARHAQTGNLVTQEGAMSTAALAGLLGLQVPAL